MDSEFYSKVCEILGFDGPVTPATALKVLRLTEERASRYKRIVSLLGINGEPEPDDVLRVASRMDSRALGEERPDDFFERLCEALDLEPAVSVDAALAEARLCNKRAITLGKVAIGLNLLPSADKSEILRRLTWTGEASHAEQQVEALADYTAQQAREIANLRQALRLVLGDA